MITAQDSETLLSPDSMWIYKYSLKKINYTSKYVAMVTTYT